MAVEQVKDDWRRMELAKPNTRCWNLPRNLRSPPATCAKGRADCAIAGGTIATFSISSMSAPISIFACASSTDSDSKLPIGKLNAPAPERRARRKLAEERGFAMPRDRWNAR